jgi:hypothetical protein
MLLDTVQHACPAATAWHDGSFGAQRYLAAVPYAIPDATTTPMGCQSERSATRYRRFWGRNSSAIVASIGMFPPRPMEERK